MQNIAFFHNVIPVFSAVGEIPDAEASDKAREHIITYSKDMSFPYLSSLPEEGRAMLMSLTKDYVIGHKISYAKNLVFDPASSNLSEYCVTRAPLLYFLRS